MTKKPRLGFFPAKNKRIRHPKGMIRPVPMEPGWAGWNDNILELFEKVGIQPSDDERPSLRYIGPGGKVLAATTAGLRGDWSGQTLSVAVDPSAQNRGIGRKITKAQLRRNPRSYYNISVVNPKMSGILQNFGLQPEAYGGDWRPEDPYLVGVPSKKRLAYKKKARAVVKPKPKKPKAPPPPPSPAALAAAARARGQGDWHVDRPDPMDRQNDAYMQGWREGRQLHARSTNLDLDDTTYMAGYRVGKLSRNR